MFFPEMATSVAIVVSEGGGPFGGGGGGGGGGKFDVNALLRVAAEREADLLVVGSRALSPLRRALIGGTARWCADHAPCAIVAVPSITLDQYLSTA